MRQHEASCKTMTLPDNTFKIKQKYYYSTLYRTNIYTDIKQIYLKYLYMSIWLFCFTQQTFTSVYNMQQVIYIKFPFKSLTPNLNAIKPLV